jgi:hypothetical protein
MKIGKLIVNIWKILVVWLILSIFPAFVNAEVLTTQKEYTFTVPDHDVNLLAVVQRDENQWWEWGWSSLKKDYCPEGDYSDSYYDWDCWTFEENNQTHGSAWEEEINREELYWKEVVDAYKWAYKNWLTTMSTIQDADPDWYLLRWHMAKIVVNFMINVLWMKLPTVIPDHCKNWNDNPAIWESDEIKWYATISCALWVMWIDMLNNEFLPNDIVSRAEFWTVVSRVLWWNTFNVVHTPLTPYYKLHLNQLKNNDIMTQINKPLTVKELRKRVWLVFKRVSEKIN